MIYILSIKLIEDKKKKNWLQNIHRMKINGIPKQALECFPMEQSDPGCWGGGQLHKVFRNKHLSLILHSSWWWWWWY